MSSEQVFRDFCVYRDETISIKRLKQEKPLRPLKFNAARKALFEELIDWCNAKNIPVRQWVYTLFVSRKWMYAPKLEKAHLCSKNHIPKFYAIDDYKFYDKYMNRVNKKKEFDPNMDITATTESRKTELLQKGGAQLCMSFMETETYGYHPKSSVCQKCDDRFICNDQLLKKVGFDILELRGK